MSKKKDSRSASPLVYLLIVVVVLVGVVVVVVGRSDIVRKNLRAGLNEPGICSNATAELTSQPVQISGAVPYGRGNLARIQRLARLAAIAHAREALDETCQKILSGEDLQDESPSVSRQPQATSPAPTPIAPPAVPELACEPTGSGCCSLDPHNDATVRAKGVDGPPANEYVYDTFTKDGVQYYRATGLFTGTCEFSQPCVYNEVSAEGGGKLSPFNSCSDVYYSSQTQLVEAIGTGEHEDSNIAKELAVDDALRAAEALAQTECQQRVNLEDPLVGTSCEALSQGQCKSGSPPEDFPATCRLTGRAGEACVPPSSTLPDLETLGITCLTEPTTISNTREDGVARYTVKVENCVGMCTCTQQCFPVDTSPSPSTSPLQQ